MIQKDQPTFRSKRHRIRWLVKDVALRLHDMPVAELGVDGESDRRDVLVAEERPGGQATILRPGRGAVGIGGGPDQIPKIKFAADG